MLQVPHRNPPEETSGGGRSRGERASRTAPRARCTRGRGVSLLAPRDSTVCDAPRAVLPWLLRIWRQLPAPLRYLYLRVRYGHFAIGVAALIRDDQGRILVVHRTYS